MSFINQNLNLIVFFFPALPAHCTYFPESLMRKLYTKKITENAGNVSEVPVECVRCNEVLMPEMGIKFHRIILNGISREI